MTKLSSSWLRPVYLLCLLGVAHCTHAQQAAPVATFAKGPTTGKALLLQCPATTAVVPVAMK